jgi:hypothetical protein
VEPGPFPSTADEAKAIFLSVLEHNFYYVTLHSGNPYVKNFVVLSKIVVQFYNDNLQSDISCGERTAVSVFNQLFQLKKVNSGDMLISLMTEPVLIQPNLQQKKKSWLRRMFRACNPFSLCQNACESD